MEQVRITECPRDAMQGMTKFIPTQVKIEYLNRLLICGFDVLDFGSFVSPKAIPQLRDTKEVLADLIESPTKLLAIVANERGVDEALLHDRISYIGYPLSISDTFQIRNTHKSISDSWSTLRYIQDAVLTKNKEMVVYLSMGFGNPYGDEWNASILSDFSFELAKIGVKKIALSDTIGCATPLLVKELFLTLRKELPELIFSAHLHTNELNASSLVEAALNGGCRDFDAAIKGFGGCPFASDKLTGNMPTELLIQTIESLGLNHSLNMNHFKNAYEYSSEVFSVQ